MIIPGFPIPFIGGSISYDVTFGAVDVTVGQDVGIYGFLEGVIGSINNNSLIAVDGNLATINEIYSTSTNNIITLLFNSNEEASAALDAINAQFTTIKHKDGFTSTFSSLVSDFSVSSNTLSLNSSANEFLRWSSDDVNETYVIKWVA